MCYKKSKFHPLKKLQDISRVQNQQNSGFSQANFDIPACFKIDLDSLPEEKRKKMEEKPSDYFNYGILKC